MRDFKSLNPKELPEGFDAQVHGEDPVIDVKESEGKIEVSFTFPGFYLSDDEISLEGTDVSFHQINIASTGFIAESGKPLLPSLGRYIQIPNRCKYKAAVKTGNKVKFENIFVTPAQTDVTDNPDEDHKLEFDNKFYDKDEFSPKEMVKITGPFEIDDYQALLVHVCPFQYNPVKKELIGYGNIIVNLDIILGKKDDPGKPPINDPEGNREAFGNLFVNPGRSIERRLELKPEAVGSYSISPFVKWGPEFQIIYYEDFKKAAEKLANWKNMRGLRTEIISINKVGNDKDKIKKYIRDKRKNFFSRLRYVLLLGDTDMIVSEEVHGNITDFYYSTSSDAADSQYVIPWISTGRIPVRTLAEATDVVDQIIAYEKTPPSDPDYYEHMSFAAFFQDNDGDKKADIYRYYMKTMESIRTYMVSIGFNVERIYVTNSPQPQFYADNTPVPADVVASIVSEATATDMLKDAASEGRLLIGHRDHGSSDGWVHPAFRKVTLESITGSTPTPFFSLNCSTGRFDLPVPTESFAEKILRIKPTAPSLIAPTRDSNTFLNNDLMKALFDAMWGGVLPTFSASTASYSIKNNRLGDILNYAKTYLPLRISAYSIVDSTTVQDHFEIFHVIGDPTLELWKEEPKRLKIIVTQKGKYLYIKLSSCPKGGVITIWWKEKLLKRIEPSSTTIRVALEELVVQPGPIGFPVRSAAMVCFWAPGYRFIKVKPRIY